MSCLQITKVKLTFGCFDYIEHPQSIIDNYPNYFKEFKEKAEQDGYDIDIGVSNAENIVRELLEREGYVVLKTSDIKLEKPLDVEVMYYLENMYKPPKINSSQGQGWNYAFRRAGAPDFLVYKKKIKKDRVKQFDYLHNLFFVEVKRKPDGFRFEQLCWVLYTTAPVHIYYVEKLDKLLYSSGKEEDDVFG